MVSTARRTILLMRRRRFDQSHSDTSARNSVTA
jgi:hypothetical protein